MAQSLRKFRSSAAAVAAIALTALLLPAGLPVNAQSRMPFNGRELFFSGSNVAWVNFASDLGPSPPDTVRFKAAFDSIHSHGGNAMRLWLHTTGANTPQFGTDGRVIGPGPMAIASLKTILNLAWQRRIGLLLTLWSFDMLDTSNPPAVCNRAEHLLTDTSYTLSYVANALIPMVAAVKAHAAIIGWEVFNEAEGMSNEFGWSTTYHVPMGDIQRFVNIVAGAIHRTDSTARVTTGAWALTSESDMNLVAKTASVESQLNAMTPERRRQIEDSFTARYGFRVSASDIIRRFAAATNFNYYRDDRLIAAGGDPMGTLDFYTDHYYEWQGTSLSPFHHPYSVWQLTKPLVIAEFFPETTLGIPYTELYRILYDNGYAGALSWGWYSGATGHPQGTLQANTMVLMQDLYTLHPRDIDDDSVAVPLVRPGPAVPDRFAVFQNYPNPFNPSTTIMFALPVQSHVTLSFFNILGQRVADINLGSQDAGVHTTLWNPALPSGVYFCRMEAVIPEGQNPKFRQTVRLLLLR